MKRDMDLIRNLLLECEEKFESNRMHYQELPRIKLGENKVVVSHYELMIESGLLVTSRELNGSNNPAKYAVSTKGYDFLDSVREQSVWEKTKSTAGEAGGFTLDILMDVAKTIVRNHALKLLGMET